MIATVTQIAAALGLSRTAINNRSKKWDSLSGSGIKRFKVDAIGLTAKEYKKVVNYLTKGKVIPLHKPDQAAVAAEAERLRLDARAQSLELFPRLPLWQQTAANAKLAIIQAADQFISTKRMARTAGQNLFIYEYNRGRIDVAPAVKTEIPQLAAGTLRSWITAEYEQGMMGLVDMYGNRKGQSKIETDPQLKATLIALIIDKPHIKACHANEALRALCPDSPWVSDKSVGRYMDAWKEEHAQEFLLATNPDSFKNKYQAAFGSRSEGIDGPNQRWEIDATPADLMLHDGRYKIIGICDVAPRRLDLYVTKTERAMDNAHSVRRCILAWGVPQLIKTDNGTYRGENFQRVLRDLEIRQEFCQAYSGDEKPFIERAFRTFSHDLVELLPGYIGHNVADRKDIESRKSFAQRLQDPDAIIEIGMTSQELQAFCDRWVASYHNRVHSELGKTPNEAVTAWPHFIHRITDERALDVLLYPVAGDNGRRTVGKKGLKINGYHYIAPELHAHIGDEVRVLETDDLGQVIVYAINDADCLEYVCIAQCAEITGISMAEVAKVTKQRQADHKAEMRRHAKESKKVLKGVDVATAVLQHREQQAAERMANVRPLPRPTVEYTTPALEAAGMARAALAGEVRQQPAAPVLSAAQQAMKAEMQAEMVQATARKIPSIQAESSKARYRRFAGLRQRVTDGEHIGADEYAALERYEQSIEFQVIRDIEQEAQRAVK